MSSICMNVPPGACAVGERQAATAAGGGQCRADTSHRPRVARECAHAPGEARRAEAASWCTRRAAGPDLPASCGNMKAAIVSRTEPTPAPAATMTTSRMPPDFFSEARRASGSHIPLNKRVTPYTIQAKTWPPPLHRTPRNRRSAGSARNR